MLDLRDRGEPPVSRQPKASDRIMNQYLQCNTVARMRDLSRNLRCFIKSTSLRFFSMTNSASQLPTRTGRIRDSRWRRGFALFASAIFLMATTQPADAAKVPTVTSVNSSTANGNYKAGGTISIQVNFSEAVTVTGTPQLTLDTGATDQVVNLASGSGSTALTCTYTVQAGDTSSDLDYQSTTALTLDGGAIRDAAGNNATLTLASSFAVVAVSSTIVGTVASISPSSGSSATYDVTVNITSGAGEFRLTVPSQ